MKSMLDESAFINLLEASEPDVMADYGEHYGCEWGFSRQKLQELIAAMPTAQIIGQPEIVEIGANLELKITVNGISFYTRLSMTTKKEANFILKKLNHPT